MPSSTERDSHPVGTTVKATQFFETIPVRKQTAVKNSAKCLLRIRRLMQAYALARPAVRFRLHVLKAKNNKSDFMYAPKASSNVEDAVLKVIGKDCALQCDWTALESDDFEIHAFLPKPTATGAKIANQGAFISVDSRPVSSTRGTMKKIVTAFKERLRKSNPSLATVKDPFFCMNIICPPDSYDPNIEPAKDDVMFNDQDTVLSAVEKLLRSYYPEAACEPEDNNPLLSERSQSHGMEEPPLRTQTPISIYEDPPEEINEEPTIVSCAEPRSEARSDQPRWRSSMYGIDEDDMEFLQENQPPILEEEEGSRAVAVSNPWTIARMNASVKARKPIPNDQLLSPAKSHDEGSVRPSSPTPFVTPRRESPVEPLTPQTSSKMNIPRSVLDIELEQSIQHLDHRGHEEELVTDKADELPLQHEHRQSSQGSIRADYVCQQSDSLRQATGSPYEVSKRISKPAPPVQALNTQQLLPPASLAPRRTQRRKQPQYDNSFPSPDQGPDDTWFGQPMRGSVPVQSPRRQKRRKEDGTPLFPTEIPSSLRKHVPAAADRAVQNRLHSENNTDIRNFFGTNGQNSIGLGSSFTPGRSTSQSGRLRGQLPIVAGGGSRSFPGGNQGGLPFHNISRASSAEPHPRSYDNTYAQSSMYRPSSAGSERPSLIQKRSNDVRSALDLYRHDRPSNNALDMVAHFKAYQDREVTSPDRASSPLRRQEPRTAPAHETTSKSRPQRRRTTDGAHRTKSSKLPLERVPHGYHVQNVVLSMHLSIASIVYSGRKLDMSRNSLEWGYSADEAYGGFAESVAERRIMDWVIKLDDVLHEQFERLPGMDTRSLLHGAIQRGLDAMKGDEVRDTVDVMDVPGLSKAGHAVEEVDNDGHRVQRRARQVSPKAEDEMSGFDMSQFIDLDMKKLHDEEARPMPTVEKTDDEFDDDIEDDMLLDM